MSRPASASEHTGHSSWRRGALLGLVGGLMLGVLTQAVSASRLGSDNAAQDVARRIAPAFEPWTGPLRNTPAARERLVFVLQAGLGGALLGAAVAAERDGRARA